MWIRVEPCRILVLLLIYSNPTKFLLLVKPISPRSLLLLHRDGHSSHSEVPCSYAVADAAIYLTSNMCGRGSVDIHHGR